MYLTYCVRRTVLHVSFEAYCIRRIVLDTLEGLWEAPGTSGVLKEPQNHEFS